MVFGAMQAGNVFAFVPDVSSAKVGSSGCGKSTVLCMRELSTSISCSVPPNRNLSNRFQMDLILKSLARDPSFGGQRRGHHSLVKTEHLHYSPSSCLFSKRTVVPMNLHLANYVRTWGLKCMMAGELSSPVSRRHLLQCLETTADRLLMPRALVRQMVSFIEEENADLRVHGLPGKKRLVCLTERVEDLVAKFNRHIGLGTVNKSDVDKMDSDDPERYCSFKKLMVWCPSAYNLLRLSAEHEILAFAYNKLNEGSDGARGDDLASLKCAVADWLMERTPTPNPTIHRQDKSGQGFYNNVTGRLLCPVDYDWSNHMMDVMTPRILPMAFKHVFTSPTSTYEEQPADLAARSVWNKNSSEHRTWCDVSTLLNMWSIQPHTIAYVSVQFYDNIVDYLELPPSPEAAKDVDDLLLWWNQKVFGRKFVSDYCPQHANKMSVAMTLARR
ncbi:uncharacterized protein EDB93DRAFT_1099241 [Suillus bovinus]|uniref:uncharacterized protein n=1 Tax=Suillus bovinus TaxID=48563 RepID=UPI001B87CAB7|nr:uncharacterized protein EDB93DRAFT_1099241 [Suillus bovinus]KAG2159780.1 hypothetical protein EDB93DRAFT_1099241 [Suillus bovinus]